ncbi:unannotated protein [freshwater metagenome]|uniref:Unannotated protein n=1 Tax=freshwater metagenome TaxID=449393 RepID=A0A6J7J2M5_9ZZZZ
MLLPHVIDDLSDAQLDDAYGWPGWPDPTPWLRVNMVATLDGAARSPDGLTAAISSDADRRVFGRLRGLADVVLVGAGTVRDEGYRPARAKPEFAARRADSGQRPVPVIAVVSRSLRLDMSSALFSDRETRPIVITCAAADSVDLDRVSEHADIVISGADEVDLAVALRALRERGLHRVHSEGGPALLADIAAQGLLDEVLLTVSPLLAGGGYAGGMHIPRIMAGSPLPDAPTAMRLHQIIEEDGTLFVSYRAS